MSNQRLKYPSCSLTLDGRSSAYSFSKASTPYEVSAGCVKYLTARLFPDKAKTVAAPPGHEADLETLVGELEAVRKAGGEPVVTLHIYRGELEGVRPLTLTPGFELKAYLDELRHWSKNGAAQDTGDLKRIGSRAGFRCSQTARLGWGVRAPKY